MRKGVRTEPLLSASWACLFSPHGRTPTEHQQSTQSPGKEKMAADGSISKPIVGREADHMFDGNSVHPRESDELEAASAEAQTK